MVASSFGLSHTTSPCEGEAAAQTHIGVFLGSFALCLGTGCLLMLPLAPPYRQIGAHYNAALLPMLFVWWGIVIPGVTYWLFRQFVSASHVAAKRQHFPDTAPELETKARDLAVFQPAHPWSLASFQQKCKCILHMVLKKEQRETIAGEPGMDEKRIASFTVRTVYGDQTLYERLLLKILKTNDTS